MVETVIPLGGTSFLIRFCSTKAMHMLLSNKPEVVEHLFCEFREWKSDDAACNHLCWVLIKGTPPYAWSEDFFKLISMKMGVMVDWSSESRSKVRFDVAEVLILTSSMRFIDYVFSLSISGKNYEIGVVESQYNSLDWEWSHDRLPFTAKGGVVVQEPSCPHEVEPSVSRA
ncbi:hypothetical protein Tsubulata_038144 [Turnera subulata]|uniref:DUF4283 domain-containing protein n=1 Tax=Turnera subulata TaxID=218843 RepID=A0A9Q0FTX6_9ROSI|nr:hypothetical protein Tsubulata_038144 [Turnera subulata]